MELRDDEGWTDDELVDMEIERRYEDAGFIYSWKSDFRAELRKEILNERIKDNE
jgi:hypothetical protein